MHLTMQMEQLCSKEFSEGLFIEEKDPERPYMDDAAGERGKPSDEPCFCGP